MADAVIAEIATGTFSSVSSRRRAVTTISSRAPDPCADTEGIGPKILNEVSASADVVLTNVFLFTTSPKK